MDVGVYRGTTQIGVMCGMPPEWDQRECWSFAFWNNVPALPVLDDPPELQPLPRVDLRVVQLGRITAGEIIRWTVLSALNVPNEDLLALPRFHVCIGTLYDDLEEDNVPGWDSTEFHHWCDLETVYQFARYRK